MRYVIELIDEDNFRYFSPDKEYRYKDVSISFKEKDSGVDLSINGHIHFLNEGETVNIEDLEFRLRDYQELKKETDKMMIGTKPIKDPLDDIK